MVDLKGKTAIITGASSGIGQRWRWNSPRKGASYSAAAAWTPERGCPEMSGRGSPLPRTSLKIPTEGGSSNKLWTDGTGRYPGEQRRSGIYGISFGRRGGLAADLRSQPLCLGFMTGRSCRICNPGKRIIVNLASIGGSSPTPTR